MVLERCANISKEFFNMLQKHYTIFSREAASHNEGSPPRRTKTTYRVLNGQGSDMYTWGRGVGEVTSSEKMSELLGSSNN